MLTVRNKPSAPPDRGGRLVPLLAVTACALVLLAAGCTSDNPTEVGRSLVTTRFDTTLVPLNVETITDYRALAIDDPDVPLKNQQLLYLGSRNGTRSSILVNFDFTELDTTGIPPEYLHPDSIKTVRFSLTRPTYYGEPIIAPDGDTLSVAPSVWYVINELEAPFDSTAYPGAPPLALFGNLNRSYEDDTAKEPRLVIDVDDFWNWYSAGTTRGFMISAGPEADTSLVAFGSRELTKFSQFDDLAVGTIVAPNFAVEFKNNEFALLAPYADISTFHDVAPVPADVADGLLVRTGLRSYPVLNFDFSALPSDVYINRAVVRVANDRSASFGQIGSLVVSELDSLTAATAGGELPLDDLDDLAYQVTGLSNLTPEYHEVLEFNVTQYVQRRINGVYEGARGLVLTAGEDFFPSFDLSTTDPDFYFREFRFFGTAAHDTLRPRLRITYSRISELDGGAP